MMSIKAFVRNSSIITNQLCKGGFMEDRNAILCHRLTKELRCRFSEMKSGLLHSDYVSEVEKPSTKILKIAIIGTPNAGKSTFINQIVGRRVFAISKKVHTTRTRARAVINLDDTQVIFLDTPGLVTQTESNKYNLEKTFMKDGELAMSEANIVGVIHDVGNSLTRGKLDPKVLRLLHLYHWKHTVLILNKVDTIKTKRYLLELVDRLSCKNLVDPQVNKLKERRTITEDEVIKIVKTQTGWPNFSQVFMVSALEGLGIGEVMEYSMQYAKPGRWMFSDPDFTDQKPEKIITDTVKAKLLDRLPDEIPYNIHVQMELYNEFRDGTISAVVVVTCPHIRSEKMIIKQVRYIAQEVEAELRSTFLTQVLIKLSVQTVDK